jgi:hypothetical protein
MVGTSALIAHLDLKFIIPPSGRASTVKQIGLRAYRPEPIFNGFALSSAN